MAVATPQDVALRLGRELAEAEVTQVQVLLADAETLIQTRIPDLHTRLATGRLAEDVVVLVEAAAVARVLRNPAGIRSQSAEAYSVDYDTRAASGFLELRPDEWRMLGVRSGLFTVAPVLPRRAAWEVPW
ncbi:phage Gp19/Gp15/Gp42 family protein [Saccharopolyspora rosea]|uniref:Phage Gp19/Gp15/Gp42 family protein n=1 Tax=Saccharopolyspora rosea TaxID=524884 RepID=A0ABW3FL71_9PSEU|nr:phage Gp19/Gp15/Gp42 family protein [Saccharopolyspora rosea]